MSELSEIVKGLNIPQQLLEKGEAAFKAVLGPSVKEFSGMLADNFRARRFKNQVKILSKAQEFLKERKIDPKEVELKILAPLVEYSSLEEDELLQEKWAKLITNIVTIDGKILLKQNCIDILKRLSNGDAKFIDYIYEDFLSKRMERYKRAQESEYVLSDRKLEDYPLSWFSFNLNKLAENLKRTRAEIELIVSNLVALGLVKWQPEVYINNAEKSDIDPNDTSLDVDVDVYDDESISLTNLGYEFVLMCKT